MVNDPSNSATIPLAVPESGALGRAAARKILVVDDEQMIADSLAAIFKMHGYEARTAYSAEQAIDVIAIWEPALAIVDVVLPMMSGIDFAILIKENHPSCHVILFSGQIVTNSLADAAASKGHAFDILAKPVAPVALLESVAQLLSSKPKAHN
jgi:DNA-binding NtrC family response regulator